METSRVQSGQSVFSSTVDEDLAMASGGAISIVGALKGAVQGAKNGSNAARGQGFIAKVRVGLKGAKLGMKGGLNQ